MNPDGRQGMKNENDIRFDCPVCAEGFGIPSISSFAEAEGATCDCPHCNALLVFDEGALKDFHKFLSEETDGLWPSDGKNTGIIEIGSTHERA